MAKMPCMFFRFMAGQAQIQQELGMNDYKIGT